jgi:hypothetical protein
VRIGIKNKEETKRGKINEGDVDWVRLSVGKEKGGEKNKGEKEKKSGNLESEVCRLQLLGGMQPLLYRNDGISLLVKEDQKHILLERDSNHFDKRILPIQESS